jgi:hypothetical protein
LAWAAGLFEGEWFFSCSWGRGSTLRLKVGLTMTDADMVERFLSITNRGKIRVYQSPYRPDHKTQYRWTAEGFENFQYFVALFWSWLGTRRRERAKELLWAAAVYYELPFIGGPGRGRPRGSRNRPVVCS